MQTKNLTSLILLLWAKIKSENSRIVLFTWGMHVDHEPKLETSLLHTKIVDVACGQNYTLALDEEGRLYSLGKGKTGVLGLASTKMTLVPLLVEGIHSGERVVSMSAGWSHVACTTALSE